DPQEHPERVAQPLAQLVSVERLLFEEAEDGEIEHDAPVRGGCVRRRKRLRYIEPIYRGEYIASCHPVNAVRTRGGVRWTTRAAERPRGSHEAHDRGSSYLGTLPRCAGTLTTRLPDGRSCVTCAAGASSASTCATLIPSSCARPATWGAP